MKAKQSFGRSPVLPFDHAAAFGSRGIQNMLKGDGNK